VPSYRRIKGLDCDYELIISSGAFAQRMRRHARNHTLAFS